jgi:outer membrane receptor protein involved in Fe transport
MYRRVLATITAVLALPATQLATAQDSVSSGELEEIIVTGSRIARSAADNMAPVGTITADDFADRGYRSMAEALNEFTSNAPQLNQAPGDGSSSGTGQQFPNLFGLGTGRTLTLLNGRRMVTSSVGLGDAQVDANIIPAGLLQRVDIVQAGGAAVYGSDAIAGVVNYVLRDDFDGLEVDLQYGDASRGDYEQERYRITWGDNFADGRANIAVNAEYSSSPSLFFSDRPRSNLSRVTQGNPADTGPNDGIPSVAEVLDAHFWNFNENGIIYNIPAPPPFALTLVDGAPAQFAPDGSIVTYNPGTILGIPFAQGGDGFRYSELAGLRTGVERSNATVTGHYDLTDSVTLNALFLYSSTKGEETPQGFPKSVLSPAPNDAIMFFNFNPFLTPEAVATLSAASPAFGGGAPLWLSRHFYYDLLPSNVQTTDAETTYFNVGLEGDFGTSSREWGWSLAASFGQVDGETRAWDVHTERFNNAVFAFPDGAGGAACFINIDGDPTNDDPDCTAVNPFGFGNISAEASAYVSVPTGQDYSNDQFNFLATIGSTLLTLPAGDVDFVVAYEHRAEDADFTPLPANQLGLVGVGEMVAPQSGDYDTNEFSVEFLVPLVGEDMESSIARRLDLSATYRWVDNSLAGTESVWSAGLSWQPVDDLTIRITSSENFRAPTLTQLIAPQSTALSAVGEDPCDADRINGGPNPAVRLANCQAEWAANPGWGDLAEFQDPAENFTVAEVTTGGNPTLRNEISDTVTYGFVLQPGAVEGLTISIDRIEVSLTDGLSAFLPEDFLATCYDSSPQPADVCSTFERLAVADGNNPGGTVISALSSTFNAGVVEYEGEYYHVAYEAGVGEGDLSLSLDATHNSKYEVSVTGTTFTRLDNTVAQPDWVSKFVAGYTFGSVPLHLSYQLFYLSDVKASANATIETTPNPVLDSNITHSLTARYDFDSFTLRAGVINIADEEPSYPSLSHGDILGRRWFVGASARFD